MWILSVRGEASRAAPRHTLGVPRLSKRTARASLCLSLILAATGCDPDAASTASENASAPKPEASKAEESKAKPAPARDMRPLAEQLSALTEGKHHEDLELDNRARLALLERGLETFLAARPGLDPDDAATQRAAIDAFIEWADPLVGRLDLDAIEGTSATSLEYAMGYKHDPSAAERERLDALSAIGVGFYEGDEMITSATLDYAGLREHLSPALSPQGQAYLELRGYAEDLTGRPSPAWVRLRKGAIVDGPAQLAKWTALAEGPSGEVWGDQERSRAVLSTYLERCATIEHTYFLECTVEPELRASYEAFIAAHPGTPEAAAVETFLAGAKARGFHITKERAFYGLLEQAMAKAER